MTEEVSFGRWLRQRRRRLDLTQEGLAKRIGYALPTIRRIEADDLRPSRELAERLADALALAGDERTAFVHLARGELAAASPLPATPVSPIPTPHSIPRHNLPVQIASFVGREREMDKIEALLLTSRLVTLTGLGGIGKTRLAEEAAAHLLDRYANGVWLVELAPLTDPTLLPQALARALNMRDEAGCPLLDTLTDYLRPKHLLLVVDNCEHLIEACAPLVETLLHSCPHLQVLATSREALGIVGETVFQVPTFSLPDRAAALSDVPSTLDQYEAMQLFAERATALQTGFVATSENLPAIAHICRTLDGIPLAIELAAARVRTLPVAQLAARLDDRFHLLTGGSRTAPSRHRSLHGMLDWSYGLLSEAEQTLLQRLSVFAGGWTLEAAEGVCSGDGIDAVDILDLLTRLVDKSLVAVESQGGEGRYRLLETIRQYAREKLVEAGLAEVLQDRHLAYFVALAEEGDIQLRGPNQMVWFQRLETELDNLRAALAWSQASLTGGEAGLRLVGALEWFWVRRGHLSEGSRWLDTALAHPGAVNRTLARARALAVTYMLNHVYDTSTARFRVQESEAIYREVGDTRGLAWILRCRGYWAFAVGDLAEAAELGRESSALYQALGDQWGLAWNYLDQADLLYQSQDRSAEARPLFEASIALFEAVGDRVHRVMALQHLAIMEEREGNWAFARAAFEERLALARELGDTQWMTLMLMALAYLAAREGDQDQATALYNQSLALQRDKGPGRMHPDLASISGYAAYWRRDDAAAAAFFREALQLQPRFLTFVYAGLAGMAGVALRRGDVARAAILLGTVAGLLAASHSRLMYYQYEYDLFLAQARAQLDEGQFAAAWAKGQAMTLEQALAYALDTIPSQD